MFTSSFLSESGSYLSQNVFDTTPFDYANRKKREIQTLLAEHESLIKKLVRERDRYVSILQSSGNNWKYSGDLGRLAEVLAEVNERLSFLK